ncbi:MAG TPA: DUF4340 domain-containing protein [Kiritimatiellia bacterium]|nr:DUF4340 domain-containing protein [Kiritimatiellia bacterium]
MTLKALIRLLIVAVLLAGLAYWLNREPDHTSIDGFASGEKAFPSLDVNSITGITVATLFTTSSVSRTDTSWVSDSLFGYPVEFSKVANMLRTFHDLKVSQVIRGGESMLDEFGLSRTVQGFDFMEISLSGSNMRRPLVIQAGALKHVRGAAEFGMGMPQGRYIRVGDGPVLLVDDMLTSVIPRAEDWMNQEIIRIPASDIVSVDVRNAGHNFSVIRVDENTFTLGDLEANEVISQSAATTLFQGLQWLRVEGVIDPAKSDEELGLDNPSVAVFTTSDNAAYTLRFGKDDSMVRVVSITLEIDSDAGVVNPELMASRELFAEWRYLLGSRRADQLLPERSQLLETPASEFEEVE